MEQAIFTTLCMVTDEKNRILVQDRQGTAWDGIALPGGHVEPGESFVHSAQREVLEETGYIMHNPLLCGIKQFQTEKGARYVILLFKASRFSGELRPSQEGNVFWLDRRELSSYTLARDMKELLQLFDDRNKSEFYYLPNQEKDSYLIL